MSISMQNDAAVYIQYKASLAREHGAHTADEEKMHQRLLAED